MPTPLSSAVCFYVGQNVEAVIRDFSNSAELVTLEDDLVAEARRVLGKCVHSYPPSGPGKKRGDLV